MKHAPAWLFGMAALAGCGGGTDSSTTSAPAPGSAYAEPVGLQHLPPGPAGYYDKDKSGQTRPVRNDLDGSLAAMVQFAQSHTIDPSGNKDREMPTLAMEREALLLITPDPALGPIDALTVEVTVNGVTKAALPLRHPREMPRSDQANTDGRPDYVYSARSWSVVLPWDWVVPGLALRVIDDRQREGRLAADKIEFAAAAELVVHSIKLGMLVEPENNDAAHWFRSNPADAATDYFQTIPVARLTAAHYEDATLRRVMVSSGVIYDTASATTGDVYSGDMRADVAKSTFSVGINLANYGVTSSGMQSQQQPQVFQSVVAHHARGVYTNGTQSHGLSGGNSILTLWTSRGNEFSHEIGHHFGLGHYPGQVGEDYFLAAHHHDSGWGYIGHRKRMRANLLWNRAITGGLQGVPVFEGQYRFAPDAMSGGDFTSALSSYTHYTGRSTQKAIQPSLDKPVPSPASPTGYTKWNAAARAMEAHAPTVPKQDTVWFNSANGKFLAPRLHGVPVVTLLGGYDPETNKALIYPAQRSNWGNVFSLPTQAVDTQEPRQCWLDVGFASGARQRIALAGKRMQANLVNKLHVNLAQNENPSNAKLQCQTPSQPVDTLYTLDIPQGLPPMPSPVIVGKEAGYQALRKVELPRLEAALEALAGKAVLRLSAADRLLYESHAAHAREMSPAAQQQLARYTAQQSQANRLNRWMAFHATALDGGVPEAQSALLDFIAALGLGTGPHVPAGQAITMPNGNCIQANAGAVRVAAPSLCTGAVSELWVLDARRSIRSRADPGQCLTDQGSGRSVALQPCDTGNDAQVWEINDTRRIARAGRCLDLNGGNLTNNVGTLITYGCTGGANQQWGG
ncbi:MAG: M66 family metalloprotease, partial [Rhizobacter sp.]